MIFFCLVRVACQTVSVFYLPTTEVATCSPRLPIFGYSCDPDPMIFLECKFDLSNYQLERQNSLPTIILRCCLHYEVLEFQRENASGEPKTIKVQLLNLSICAPINTKFRGAGWCSGEATTTTTTTTFITLFLAKQVTMKKRKL